MTLGGSGLREAPAGRVTQALRTSDVSLMEKVPRVSMVGGTGFQGGLAGAVGSTQSPLGINFL